MKKLFILLVMPWHILTWSDFKGNPCGDNAASSSTNILWSYDLEEGGCVSHISAEANFDPDKSWTITNNLYILKHEQGHLDIARIVCERVFREINPHKKYTEKEWLRLKFDYEEQWFQLDDNYDAKTEHSKNRQAQAKWNSWIAEQLKK